MICVQHTFWCFVGWNDRILRIKELAFGRILTITENKDGILIVMTNRFSKHRQNSFILYFFFCNATTMHKHRQIGNTKKKIEISHQEQERCVLRIAKEIFYNCMGNRN